MAFGPGEAFALFGRAPQPAFQVDVAHAAESAEAGERAIVIGGSFLLQDDVVGGSSEAFEIERVGAQEEFVRAVRFFERDAVADAGFVADRISLGIVVQGNEQAAVRGEQTAQEAGQIAVKPVEDAFHLGAAPAGIQAAQILLRPDAGEHAVRVELAGVGGHVAVVPFDEKSDSARCPHVFDEDLAGRGFVAVDVDVAAGGRPALDDPEPGAADADGGVHGDAHQRRQKGAPAEREAAMVKARQVFPMIAGPER